MARATKKHPDLLLAVFGQIAESGWSDTVFRDAAAGAGVGLDEACRQFRSRSGLIAALGARLDEAMLAVPPAELEDMDVRERLFELLMRRFDAMAPFRPGLRRLARDARCEPHLLLRGLLNLDRMTDWLLEGAGIRLRGPRRHLARKALMVLYVRVLRVWLRDDSEDQAATLAELDKGLARLEAMARFGARRARRPEPAAA